MGMNHELYISTGSEERIQFSIAFGVSRRFCNRSFGNDDRFECVDESLKKGFERSDFDSILDEKLGFCEVGSGRGDRFSLRRGYIENARNEAGKVMEILRQDGPGFDTKSTLDTQSIADNY